MNAGCVMNVKKHPEAGKTAIRALENQVAEELLIEPVEYIHADHDRHRILSDAIDEIASAPAVDDKLITTALKFLENDFHLHIQDEEKDLFPALCKRAKPQDKIELVLSQLIEEHENNNDDVRRICKVLAKCSMTKTHDGMSSANKALLSGFAGNERRHLMVENAIVLPLARVRLSEDDKKEISGKMAARRGLTLSGSQYD